jgi:hypothetical protein
VIDRLAARARGLVKEQEDCGAPSGRIRFFGGQPLGAPLMRRYQALSTAYPCRALSNETRSRRPRDSTQGVWFEDPRGRIALLLAQGHGLQLVSGRAVPRLPRAPQPSSRDTDGLQLASSWTRDACSVSARRGAGITFPKVVKPSGYQAGDVRCATSIAGTTASPSIPAASPPIAAAPSRGDRARS